MAFLERFRIDQLLEDSLTKVFFVYRLFCGSVRCISQRHFVYLFIFLFIKGRALMVAGLNKPHICSAARYLVFYFALSSILQDPISSSRVTEHY